MTDISLTYEKMKAFCQHEAVRVEWQVQACYTLVLPGGCKHCTDDGAARWAFGSHGSNKHPGVFFTSQGANPILVIRVSEDSIL